MQVVRTESSHSQILVGAPDTLVGGASIRSMVCHEVMERCFDGSIPFN